MPIGDLTAFMTYIMQILIVGADGDLHVRHGAAGRGLGRAHPGGARTEPSVSDPEQPVVDCARRGHVEFSDVEFRYPGAEDPVL